MQEQSQHTDGVFVWSSKPYSRCSKVHVVNVLPDPGRFELSEGVLKGQEAMALGFQTLNVNMSRICIYIYIYIYIEREIYTYIYIYVYIYIYIYIYMYRERERCMHVYVYIYIYIYTTCLNF